MWKSHPDKEQIELEVLLLPHFNLVDVSLFLGCLAQANQLCGKTAFVWRTLGYGSRDVPSRACCPWSADVLFQPVQVSVKGAVNLVVIGNCDPATLPRDVASWLRSHARHGASVGFIGQHAEALQNQLKGALDAPLTRKLFSIAPRGFACAGGVAVLDLMAELLERHLGRRTALLVLAELAYDQPRAAGTVLFRKASLELGTQNEILLRAVELIEKAIDRPLRASHLAKALGISPRQVQRLFKVHLGVTPSRYHLQARLHRARHLLLTEAQRINAIAWATGFVSPSHFAKAYLDEFGRTPSAERRLASQGSHRRAGLEAAA